MKIYVGNLPFSVDDEGLKKVFSKYEVGEITLIRDNFSGRSKGFGFVTIADEESAKKALHDAIAKLQKDLDTYKEEFKKAWRGGLLWFE